MCILNHFGRMNKYVEYDDLEKSSNQFVDSVPKISEYINNTDPRPFFIDRELGTQDAFLVNSKVGYIGLVGKLFSFHAMSGWTWDSNPLKELIRLLNRIIKYLLLTILAIGISFGVYSYFKTSVQELLLLFLPKYYI